MEKKTWAIRITGTTTDGERYVRGWRRTTKTRDQALKSIMKAVKKETDIPDLRGMVSMDCIEMPEGDVFPWEMFEPKEKKA